MDLHKMIAELQLEKQRLDEAILALERLVAGKNPRRGRPARWLADEIESHMNNVEDQDVRPDPHRSSEAVS